jgi:hypothetical protein
MATPKAVRSHEPCLRRVDPLFVNLGGLSHTRSCLPVGPRSWGVSRPGQPHFKGAHGFAPTIKLHMTSSTQHEASDTAQTTYQSILEHEITEGLRELERPTTGLLISGVSAGLDVSLSLFLMVVILTLTQGQLNSAVAEMLSAAMYSVGFIVVILGRSELFTEHTTRAVYPSYMGARPLHGSCACGA